MWFLRCIWRVGGTLFVTSFPCIELLLVFLELNFISASGRSASQSIMYHTCPIHRLHSPGHNNHQALVLEVARALDPIHRFAWKYFLCPADRMCVIFSVDCTVIIQSRSPLRRDRLDSTSGPTPRESEGGTHSAFTTTRYGSLDNFRFDAALA